MTCDGLDHLAEQPAVRHGVVDVTGTWTMKRTLQLDGLDDGVPGEDVFAREVDIEGGQPGPMTHRVADRQSGLLGGAELRPVSGDGRIEIEPSLLHEQIRTQSEHTLRAREDHRGGVAVPQPRGSSVGDAAPDVHDGMAVDVHGTAGPEILPLHEVRHERVQNDAVPGVNEALDPTAVLQDSNVRRRLCRQGPRLHPLTDRWSSAAIT